jgi:nucleotide-binding universal stress UspA family protein
MVMKKKKAVEVFEVEKALVALELGPADNAMLDYLNFFTSQIPTQSLYFLHALPKLDLFYAMFEEEGEGVISNYELNTDAIELMETQIKDKVKSNKTTKIGFEVREGDPLEELLKEAEVLAIDLVAIGQKSEAGRHEILARNLARKVDCNALVIPEKAKPKLAKILVPIDFSPDSAKALQTAVALNNNLKQPAKIICLNVYEMPNLSVYRIQKTREQFKNMVEEDRMTAFKAFLNKYAPDAASGIQIELIEKDLPGIANYLMEFAEDSGVDFIAMGAKGHSKVELLLMGSVTERLLSMNQTIPTLIVK